MGRIRRELVPFGGSRWGRTTIKAGSAELQQK